MFTSRIVCALFCCGSWGLALAQGVTLPATERVVLENGTVLILNEKPDVPMIGVQAVLRGGAVADPDGKSGLASLFAALIEKGAGERDSAAFAEAIDAVGGSLSARAGLEGITISGDFLARDVDLMLQLLADMLMRPSLKRAELDKLRARSINFILAAKDSNPGDLMPIYAGGFLFGDHPYGNSVAGNETSLAAISHRDVLRYYEQQVGGDRLIISVSGYFDAADMRDRLTAAFADWRAASGEMAEVAALELQTGRRVLLIDKPGATQTYFWIGNVGVARNYEHRPDLDIANTVFGGRFTSMLNTALRIESGLTYGASSRLLRPSKPGSIGISSYTATDTTVEAIDMALGILGQLRDTGIAEDMISSARNYVLGQFPMRLETATQLAAQFAVLEAYGLTNSYIDDYGAAISAVTVESITAVIDAVYPQHDDLVFVLLGDAASIRETAANYGPMTEMSITEPRFRPSQ
ncbi:MAG: insulinase family protein [Gammaproteobacteria bacterium]|nr:insulinase family protein [Gammaproteobacteria bacterium]